jgi:tetratricopeptide (TPR) repeat protein
LHEKSVEKARQLLEEGDPEGAIAILEPLVEEDDEDVEALVILGIAYVQAEECSKAIRVLESADTLAEDHCVIKMFLGRALLFEGKYDYALDMIRESIELDDSEPAAWADMGRVHYRQHDYRNALKALAEASKRFPDDISINALHALTLYRLGDYTAATEEWAKVHRLQPDLMAAISNYAYLLLIQDRSFEAAPFVGAANTIDSEDYRSLILLGELRFKSGDLEGATEAFLHVLGQDSENVEALARLALILHLSQDAEMSRHYLSRAEMQLGENPESWRGLCSIYPLLGMVPEYVDCLIQWAKADKGAATPWVFLAVEYVRQGKHDEALEAWRKSFELRGYVKIRCPACGTEDRRPYDGSEEFDPFRDTVCANCGEKVRMPQGLAAD